MQKNYRPDIDGLRAIAIGSVLVFHAFPNIFPNGFIGVDIFFVISGYLVSNIIFKNLFLGEFSFVEFYCRRVNRILPALFLVLIFCIIVGWFLLLAGEYRHLGKHVAAGAGFISNVVLLQEINYFDSAADTKPLLHLWSLGIEEQFYFFWPIVVVIFVRWVNYFFVGILVLLLTSFGVGLFYIEINQSAAFYLPQARFWEMMAGGTLAWANSGYSKTSRWSISDKKRILINNAFSILGCIFFVIGFFFVNQLKVFPGWWALFPVLGTVLLICAGPNSLINKKILSNIFLVWIGLISFPLYLWHWPILTFPRIVIGQEPGLMVKIILLSISILLAWVTYFFLEKKIRRRQTKKMAFLFFVMIFLLGLTGFNIFLKDGYPDRKYANLIGYEGDIGHDEFHKYVDEHFEKCSATEIAERADIWNGYVRCSQSKLGVPVDTVVLCDSHAEHLYIGLAEALMDKNVAFYTKGDMPFMDGSNASYLIEYIGASEKISSVIISAYLGKRLELMRPEVDFKEELKKTVVFLKGKGKKVSLILDLPIFTFKPELCKGYRWIYKKESKCSMPLSEYHTILDLYKKEMEALAVEIKDVAVINPESIFCDDKICSMVDNGKILYRDFNHLNIEGSKLFGNWLVDRHREKIIRQELLEM